MQTLAKAKEEQLIDGTAEPVNVTNNATAEGVVGIDSESGKRMFVWNQVKFRIKNGYSMSQSLLNHLADTENVELVYILKEDIRVPLRDIMTGERVGPENKDLFNGETPDEVQYVYKV